MSGKSKKREIELSDQQRAAMSQTMRAQDPDARRLGFALRGSEQISSECLVAEMPGTLSGEVSCCGAKDFLIDEVREFKDPKGKSVSVRCASAAVLEMVDAPVHKHAATLEYYIVLSGSGKMVLGEGDSERIVPVKEGSVVLLPPGQPHGIASNDPDVAIKALLTFTPGLAPVSHPEFRDEEIVHARTSDRIRDLEG